MHTTHTRAARASVRCGLMGAVLAAAVGAALPLADRIYWTAVDASPEGDVRFPDADLSGWTEVERNALPSSEKDDVTATLRVLDRKG